MESSDRMKDLEERVSELEFKVKSSAWPEMYVSKLRDTQKQQLISMAKELGIFAEPLTEKELIRFGRSYDRQLRLDDIHLRHQKEALLGAMIAKYQLGFEDGPLAEIDGELPAHGRVQGPVTIRASWFGVGDDWYMVDAWVLGEWNPWIDVVVHDAVHVVYGIQSLIDKPIIEAVQFIVDGKTKAVQQTRFTEIRKPGQMNIREFDNAYIFKENTVVKVNVFLSKNVPLETALDYPPTHALDVPKLYGVSFVPYKTALELE